VGGIGFRSWASAVRWRGIVSPSVGEVGMSNRTLLFTLGTSNRTCLALFCLCLSGGSSEVVGVAEATLCCSGIIPATLCMLFRLIARGGSIVALGVAGAVDPG
jgi:hypothetical protein